MTETTLNPLQWRGAGPHRLDSLQFTPISRRTMCAVRVNRLLQSPTIYTLPLTCNSFAFTASQSKFKNNQSIIFHCENLKC